MVWTSVRDGWGSCWHRCALVLYAPAVLFALNLLYSPAPPPVPAAKPVPVQTEEMTNDLEALIRKRIQVGLIPVGGARPSLVLRVHQLSSTRCTAPGCPKHCVWCGQGIVRLRHRSPPARWSFFAPYNKERCTDDVVRLVRKYASVATCPLPPLPFLPWDAPYPQDRHFEYLVRKALLQLL